MSDYLSRLIARDRGGSAAIRPLVRPLFAAPEAAPFERAPREETIPLSVSIQTGDEAEVASVAAPSAAWKDEPEPVAASARQAVEQIITMLPAEARIAAFPAGVRTAALPEDAPTAPPLAPILGQPAESPRAAAQRFAPPVDRALPAPSASGFEPASRSEAASRSAPAPHSTAARGAAAEVRAVASPSIPRSQEDAALPAASRVETSAHAGAPRPAPIRTTHARRDAATPSPAPESRAESPAAA
jgi:hypothetical protein